MYDPLGHADELGVRVAWGNPGTGNDGLYLEERRLIVIRQGLNSRTERSTLAHECVHAIFHDMPTHGLQHIKQERRADREAARRLINPFDLETAAKATSNKAQWCIDLQVDPWVLTVYLKNHMEAQYAG